MSDIQKQSIRIDDFDMEYVKFGTGPKPVVIIPGIAFKSPLSSASATIVAEGFKAYHDDFTFYLIDRRTDLPQGFRIENMTDDIAKTLKALGISNTFVFGASQGGMIAQYLAIRYPELVGKLVLASSTSRAEPLQLQVIGEWVRFAEAGDTTGLVSSFIANAFTPSYAERYSKALQMFFRRISEAELARFAVMARACDFVNTYDDLGKIQCPVFVIKAGVDHVVTPEASDKIVDKLKAEGKDVEFYEYAEGGHAIFDEAKDYKDRTIQFFQKN